jgi:hypothetical protein
MYRMSEWIKVRAAEIRSVESERKAERSRQLDASNKLKAKIAPFWNELAEVLQDSVKEFNIEFSESERLIDHFEKTATMVTIKRTAYPAALVRAQLNSGGNSVHYQITQTQRKNVDSTEKQGSFVFGIIQDDVGYVEGGVAQHEDVAKLLLEPFFQF